MTTCCAVKKFEYNSIKMMDINIFKRDGFRNQRNTISIKLLKFYNWPIVSKVIQSKRKRQLPFSLVDKEKASLTYQSHSM
jgi:hypothetical protein